MIIKTISTGLLSEGGFESLELNSPANFLESITIAVPKFVGQNMNDATIEVGITSNDEDITLLNTIVNARNDDKTQQYLGIQSRKTFIVNQPMLVSQKINAYCLVKSVTGNCNVKLHFKFKNI